MGLDTMHDREFYLAKAEEHEMLEQVIAGETTFTQGLEGIFDRIVEVSKKKKILLGGWIHDYGPDDTPLKVFAGYLDTVVALSGVENGVLDEWKSSMEAYWEARAGRSCKRFWRWTNVGGNGLVAAAVGVLLLVIPGGALVDLAVIGAGAAGVTAYVDKGLNYFINADKEERRCKKVLEPLYDLARKLDYEIATLFAVEHYTENDNTARGCFEQTYPLLSDEQRQQVNAQLYAFLGAGGMPGMDEQQLKGYLCGLLEPEAK